jgi:hypothetical protein
MLPWEDQLNRAVHILPGLDMAARRDRQEFRRLVAEPWRRLRVRGWWVAGLAVLTGVLLSLWFVLWSAGAINLHALHR